MTEPSIIERVAKAICEGSGDYCFQREVTSASGNCVTCLNQARAAIQAMYQPNDYMVESAFDGPTFRSASKTEIANCWRLMVCAALKETTP